MRKEKTLVIIGDGMADEPLEELGGRTPLEAAATPAMDSLAREGFTGLVRNVPTGMEPGSDVAIMSILGYDPSVFYTGRGPLEALSMGIRPADDETVFRCNFVSLIDDLLVDYSAGHITTAESAELIAALQDKLGSDRARFHHGVSFRNLLVCKGDFSRTKTYAPHDHMDEPWNRYLPSGPGSEFLVNLIEESMAPLCSHTLNRKRVDAGKKPANSIWPWSGGRLPSIDPYAGKFGLEGVVVSAVDLVQGLGAAAGLAAAKVPGATGMVDTNYEGKVAAAIDSMEKHNFTLIHVEGMDEAGHIGDPELKMEGVRRFDSLVVAPLVEYIRKYDDFLLLLLPDHPTPIRIRTHNCDPVPFVALRPGVRSPASAPAFTEAAARATGISVLRGHTLLESLLNGDLY